MIVERGHIPLGQNDNGKDTDSEADCGDADHLPPGQPCCTPQHPPHRTKQTRVTDPSRSGFQLGCGFNFIDLCLDSQCNLSKFPCRGFEIVTGTV